MDERIFKKTGDGGIPNTNDGAFSVRLDKDSYIIFFEGRRGGGKTTSMSYFVVRSAALYNMPIISNYEIEFYMRRYHSDGTSYLQHVKSEPLDFEKLLAQDSAYEHCLIVIDESPDVISHMASVTWKNRLVNAFTRQIRKDYNTLFMAGQDLQLVDKSMRWQVDIRVECKDVSRAMGEGTGLERGEMLELKWFDESGQWTSKTTQERKWDGESYVTKMNLFPRLMFGDKTHKAVFDSWKSIDILDSLRRVDLKLGTIKVGDHGDSLEDKYPISPKILTEARNILNDAVLKYSDNPNIYQKWFYKSLGAISEKDKNNLGKVLSKFNMGRGGDGSERFYGLEQFDSEGFNAFVDMITGKG